MRYPFLFFTLLLLTSCTVGPDYKEPEMNLPKDWKNKPSHETKLPLEEKDIAWWKNFNDPMLNNLVEDAARANLTIEEALARVREAGANLDIVNAGFFPSVTASGSVQKVQNSLNSIVSSNNQLVSSGTVYAAGASASWQLDIFGQNQRLSESASDTIESTIENTRATLLTIISQVAQNYMNLRGYQQQKAILIEIITTWQDYLRLQKDAMQAGLVDDIDTATAESSLATAKAALPGIETNIKTSIHQLSILLGKEPTYLYQKLLPPKEIPTTSTVIISDLPSSLLHQRPDIMMAERNLAASTANIGATEASLFPSFSLTGTYGFQSTSTSNLFSSRSEFFSIGPGFSLPIFDFGKIKAQINLQYATRDEEFAVYKETILKALQDVENALVSFSNEEKHLYNLQNVMDRNFTIFKLTDKRFQSGLEALIAVYQSKVTYLQSKINFVQSKAARSLDLILLYQALGGGWNAVIPAKKPPKTAG